MEGAASCFWAGSYHALDSRRLLADTDDRQAPSPARLTVPADDSLWFLARQYLCAGEKASKRVSPVRKISGNQTIDWLQPARIAYFAPPIFRRFSQRLSPSFLLFALRSSWPRQLRASAAGRDIGVALIFHGRPRFWPERA